MADDINLPNLVSHLAVNLDGTNGAIADAARQGSSMGAALGAGVQRELSDLVSHLPEIELNGDSTDLDRDLARVRAEMDELSQQRIGIDIPIDQAIRRINELQPHLDRLSEQHPDINVQASTRQAAAQLDAMLAAARHVDDTDVDIDVEVHVDEDRPNRLLGILGRVGAAGAAAGASIAAGMGTASAAVGALIPAAGAVVTTLANIAPAAGVAVTGLTAVKLVTGTVKLAAIGMEDALTAALDPEKASEYAEALKKLSPEARKFAEAIHDAGPTLRRLQQSVQDRVFDGLAKDLERTGKVALPVLRTSLLSTAGSLNSMASGVLAAGRHLAANGTLGQALGSATKGLHQLTGVPGIVVTALGQIGAAAGPSFERLTSAAADAATGIGARLGRAFESGAMQDAIEHAIDLLGQLLDVGANVGSIIGSVFNAVPAGGGMIGVLEDVTAAIADIAKSDGVQDALGALFETMGTLGSTVAPLLSQALAAVAPVLTALGPPAQILIESLGEGLSPIIEGLGPVLLAAAGAVGSLVEALAPLLPVAGELIASLLPALTPLLDACQVVFEALAPVVQQVAAVLQETLAPILAELPSIIEPLAAILAGQLVFWLQLLGDLLVELSPSLVMLGQSFADLMVATAPLIEIIAQLTSRMLADLLPALAPVIAGVGELAAILAGQLAAVIRDVVIPAIQLVAAVLRGDFSSALTAGKALASGFGSAVVGIFVTLPGRIASALAPLASQLGNKITQAGLQMVSAARSRVSEAVSVIGRLPSMAASALGGLGGVLVSAGASLINGLIAGIRSRIPSVQGVLNGLTSKLPDWKGPKGKDAKILTPAGKLLIQGFIDGIDSTTAKLRSKLASITKALPANVRSGYGKTLARSTKELARLVGARDVVIKQLAAAEKKLADLVKARNKASTDITKGILQDANITTGNNLTNSVSAITVGLQTAVKRTKEFQDNIAKLRKSGLRADLLQQIADAGVDGGSATAAALAKATPAELKKINDLQAQLAASAKSTGDTVGDALYAGGIRAAEGLVKGLKSQEKAIERAMERIAKSMLNTVKKVHKTRSPSRAFAEIGRFDGIGLEQGFLSTRGRVQAAARSVADAALSIATTAGRGLAVTPTGPQLATAYAGGGGTGAQHNTFNLYGTEASPDGILRALSWRGLVGRG